MGEGGRSPAGLLHIVLDETVSAEVLLGLEPNEEEEPAEKVSVSGCWVRGRWTSPWKPETWASLVPSGPSPAHRCRGVPAGTKLANRPDCPPCAKAVAGPCCLRLCTFTGAPSVLPRLLLPRGRP